MKRKVKKMLFIFSILFLPILLIFVFYKYIELRAEQDIMTYISKNTPLGSSKDDVKMFIGKKEYEIIAVRNFPHKLRGATLPRIDFVIYPKYSKERYRGVSSIYVVFLHIFGPIKNIVSFMCTWVFDEDDKLILIDVYKEWNAL